METHRALEILFICLSVGLFGGYHMWIFWLAVRVFPKRTRSNMFYINRKARDAWARESSRAKDAAGQTYIAQTLRNSITAASLLATACSLIAVTGVGNIILDEQKLSMLENIVKKDPILHGNKGIISPTLKLAIVEAMVLFTFLFFTQCIRLSVNMGFYAKIIHSEDNGGFYLEEELAAISKRAAICFTLGMRFFYAIIPLIFWVAGPTWMLAITALLVFSLIVTDHIAPAKQQRKSKDIETGTPKSATNDAKTAQLQD